MALLQIGLLKFIYSEKATKFCEIFPVLLTTVHTVKSKGTISQNFVAFSEYVCIWTLQRRLLITTDPTTNFETTNLIFSQIIDHSEQVLYILSVAVYAINKQSDWPNICENLEFAVSELDVDTPQFGQTLLGIAIDFLSITQNTCVFFNLKSKQLDWSSNTKNISREIVISSKNSNPKF